MFDLDTSEFRLPTWPTLVVVGAGLLAFALVVVLAVLVRRWRRRRRLKLLGDGALADDVSWEDLSWEDLLELLRRRGRERKEAGAEPDEDVPAEELMEELLAGLPARALRVPAGAAA